MSQEIAIEEHRKLMQERKLRRERKYVQACVCMQQKLHSESLTGSGYTTAPAGASRAGSWPPPMQQTPRRHCYKMRAALPAPGLEQGLVREVLATAMVTAWHP